MVLHFSAFLYGYGSVLTSSLMPGHFVTTDRWQRLWTTHVQTGDAFSVMTMMTDDDDDDEEMNERNRVSGICV